MQIKHSQARIKHRRKLRCECDLEELEASDNQQARDFHSLDCRFEAIKAVLKISDLLSFGALQFT